MSAVQFRPDLAGIAALERSQDFQRLAETVATDGLDYAQSIAPVLTGDYRDAFRVEAGTGEARIVNDDPGAIAIENGAPARPGFHVLARTIDYIESR